MPRRPADPGPVFTALADDTRRGVLRAVARADGVTATELADELPVTRQAVAKHLRVLADAGLVATEKAGRAQLFRATPAPFTDAVAWMVEVGAAWDTRLDRLARAARRR